MTSAAERRERVAEEAAEWLLRLESDSLSVNERAQYVDWLRESPLHVAEMIHVARLQKALVDFTRWGQIAPVDSTSESSVPTLPVSPYSAGELNATSRPSERSRST